MRLCIDGFWVADFAKHLRHIRKDSFVRRVLRKVGQFFGVLREVEKLRLKSDIVDQLPLSPPEHECPRHRSCGVVLTQYNARFVSGLVSNLIERLTGAIVLKRQTKMIRDRSGDIEEADRRLAHRCLLPRARYDQRHSR